jgi:hypothetical protein
MALIEHSRVPGRFNGNGRERELQPRRSVRNSIHKKNCQIPARWRERRIRTLPARDQRCRKSKYQDYSHHVLREHLHPACPHLTTAHTRKHGHFLVTQIVNLPYRRFANRLPFRMPRPCNPPLPRTNCYTVTFTLKPRKSRFLNVTGTVTCNRSSVTIRVKLNWNVRHFKARIHIGTVIVPRSH